MTIAVWRRWRAVMVGGGFVGAILLVALAAPVVAPYNPGDLDVMDMLTGPSAAHWLGTDEAGRDVLSRLLYAARVSMLVAFVAVVVGLVLGSAVGLTAAYAGRWLDLVLMRLMDLLLSFPAILLAIVLMASLGTSVANVTIAIGIVFVPAFARLSRAAAGQVLREPYIVAAEAIGMSWPRILLRHVLPNIAPSLLAATAAALSTAVVLEAAFSFLGLGVQIPDPSFGNMLDTGRGFLSQAPWLVLAPGIAIAVIALGFTLIAGGLRDATDPRRLG